VAERPTREELDRFIETEIDTVPQLEALLLLWNSRPRIWPLADLAAALYISADETKGILAPLERRTYVRRSDDDNCSYSPGPHDATIAALEATYRRELIRTTRMIHAKPSSSLREFARAFIFKKEKD
jgi:DNA-binding IclR family transcriptional regulator